MSRPKISFPIRESLIPESVIAAVSIAMLVWVAWPRLPDQRIVQARLDDGQTKSFAMSVDDPRLNAIQTRIDAWQISEPLAKIGQTRWEMEAAQHYAELRSQQPPIVTVTRKPKAVLPASFTLPGSEPVSSKPATPPAPDPSTIDWDSVAKRNHHRLAAINNYVDNARSNLGPPPFSVSAPVEGGRPNVAVVAAGISALLMFALMGVWQRIAPPVRLDLGDGASMTTAKPGNGQADLIAMKLPAGWVHLHQPFAVVARGAMVAGLFFAGVAAVWLS